MDLKEAISRDLMMLWMLMGQSRGSSRRGSFGRSAPLDPTRGRGRIIAMLKIKDGLSAKELAQVLGIRVSSLNETLSKMEKDGLVRREPSSEDKRVILVYLTDEGRAVEVDEREELDMLEGFTDDELKQLSAFLSRMLNNVGSELGEDAVENMREEWEERSRILSSMGGFAGHGPIPSWGGGPGGFGPRFKRMF